MSVEIRFANDPTNRHTRIEESISPFLLSIVAPGADKFAADMKIKRVRLAPDVTPQKFEELRAFDPAIEEAKHDLPAIGAEILSLFQ